MTCLGSPSTQPLGWGHMPGWRAGGCWQLASVLNPRQADNDSLIHTAQGRVAEPQGSGLGQGRTVQPRHTLGGNTESHPCPIPQPGENPLGLSETKARP